MAFGERFQTTVAVFPVFWIAAIMSSVEAVPVTVTLRDSTSQLMSWTPTSRTKRQMTRRKLAFVVCHLLALLTPSMMRSVPSTFLSIAVTALAHP